LEAILLLFDDYSHNDSMAVNPACKFLGQIFGQKSFGNEDPLHQQTQLLIKNIGNNGILKKKQLENYLSCHPNQLKKFACSYRKNVEVSKNLLHSRV
jgi:hypothetical protein